MMHSRMLKPFLYALAALGAYHTWGRTIADGTLTHLLHAMHSKDGYILPGTDSFLRTSITGIYWPIDYLLDILIVFFWEAVDGSHPTTSAIGIYFLSQFLSVLTGLYVDSLRHGQPRGTPFRTMLWLLSFQMMAIATTGPYWALWYISATPLISHYRSLPDLQQASMTSSRSALLVIPSVAIGYILTAVSMCLPSPSVISHNFKQLALVAWNVFPIGVFLVHTGLEAIVPRSRSGEPCKQRLVTIRIVNGVSLLFSLAVHLGLISMSLTTVLFPPLWAPHALSDLHPASLAIPPMAIVRGATVGDGIRSFFIWDQVFGYTVVILVAVLQLQTVLAAVGRRLNPRQLVAVLAGGIILAGPGSTCLGLNWMRDEVVLDSEQWSNRENAVVSDSHTAKKIT